MITSFLTIATWWHSCQIPGCDAIFTLLSVPRREISFEFVIFLEANVLFEGYFGNNSFQDIKVWYVIGAKFTTSFEILKFAASRNFSLEWKVTWRNYWSFANLNLINGNSNLTFTLTIPQLRQCHTLQNRLLPGDTRPPLFDLLLTIISVVFVFHEILLGSVERKTFSHWNQNS